jgi:stage IV sporulation protein FB
MEQSPGPLPEEERENQSPAVETPVAYPPKFQKAEKKSNIWLRSIISLALYLVLGNHVFPSPTILLLITAIVIFHELGHLLAMKYFRYSDLGIFFIPLLGAYVSGSKREVSQKQSSIILLAGPLPGIILGIIFFLADQNSTTGIYWFDISLSRIALLLIILNLINLFPIYPLDGGQLLQRVFLDEESWIGKIFVFASAAFMVYIAWKTGFWVLLIFPVMMLLRLAGDTKMGNVEKRLETEGINLDVSYEDLSDEDYWKTRNILIEEHPSFKDIQPAPPFEYSHKEDKIMSTIQMLLHRHLIQDVSIAGKIFILIIWVAAFASPWLLKMDMSFFSRFGI